MSNTTGAGPPPFTYKDAGVDIDAGNRLVQRIKGYARSTARSGTDAALGGFGGLFDLKAAGYTDPVLIAANDGVGTKLKIAIDTGIHDTVGIDLVAMCVNDLIVQGGEPLFFLDYLACGTLDEDVAETVIAGIAEGCRQAGAALIGGETAEMPGMYADGDYDLAGFAVGAAERGGLLPRDNITAGDIILGLASNGPHSNGYSLIRRLVESQRLSYADPAPFDTAMSLGQALLAPTRIYVPAILAALKQTDAIKALAHITGGGFIENIPRVLPSTFAARIDLDSLQIPKVFSWLTGAGNMTEHEMLKTFNCGTGMIAVVDAASADEIASILDDAGERVTPIGGIIDRTGDAIEFTGGLDLER